MSQKPAPIVVGVDGSEASVAALRWAADEAVAHHAPLIAVHVLDPRDRIFAPYAGPRAREADGLDAAVLVERLISEGGLGVVQRVFETGVPSQALVRCATGARMLVLGHADHHRRRDGDGPHHVPVLGAIARACVAHATCPVVVVPLPARLSARRRAEPEPRRIPAAQGVPLTGGRAIYPTSSRIPVGHG